MAVWRPATASNHLPGSRDITGLGDCNFQFYDSAAWHYSARRRCWFGVNDIGLLP
jgi:hypothetical protein